MVFCNPATEFEVTKSKLHFSTVDSDFTWPITKLRPSNMYVSKQNSEQKFKELE